MEQNKELPELKHDINVGKKPAFSLLPASALVEVVRAMEDGARKRSRYNWRENGTQISTMDIMDKILRHAFTYIDRQDISTDSKLHEIAHLVADGLVLLDAYYTGHLCDDRPMPGTTGEQINDSIK